MAKIARLGDPSNHGGSIVDTNADDTVLANGIPVAVDGAQHSCPITGHGTTSVSPIAIKTSVNGKLVITVGAQAGCGAIISDGSPNVFVE